MKAIVIKKYGSPEDLVMEEVEKPVPGENEVLVKVEAASLNAGDWHLLRGEPFIIRLLGYGLFKPKKKIPGLDAAGKVVHTGSQVHHFKPGDEVFGDFSEKGSGAFAQYACVSQDSLALKPDGWTFPEAAAVPTAGLAALQGLRDQGGLQPGQRVLINGASGGVGSFAVQTACALGGEVTAVGSTAKMEMMRSLGASQVVDYTREDITQKDERYDLILAANGFHSIFAYRQSLSPRGTFVNSGGAPAQFFQTLFLGPWLSRKKGRKMKTFVSKPNPRDLVFLTDLFTRHQLKPVLDKTYPLDQVPQALSYLEEGHARGKVIISMPASD